MMLFMLAACARSSTAQTAASYSDSLYTYLYLKHRLYVCGQRFHIPRPERRCFQRAASKADSLAKRWPREAGSPDAFLPYWAAHPELEESEARAALGLPQPVAGNCEADSTGYARSRSRLTALQLAAYEAERRGDTTAAFAFLDTLSREYRFSLALFRAKRLATASRDTAAYLRAFAQSRYDSMAEARKLELNWSTARTAGQKGFISACLALADSTAIRPPVQEPQELRRRLGAFADMQDISGNCVFARSKLPPFLRRHKRLLRRIYLDINEEGYTKMPHVVCRYLRTPDSISREAMSVIRYLNLHLIQLNGFGQIYPDSLFGNYFGFLRQLAYAGVMDMEECVSLRDEYLMIVKGLPPEFGYTTRRAGFELDYGTAPSAAVSARREAAGLLPLEAAISW